MHHYSTVMVSNSLILNHSSGATTINERSDYLIIILSCSWCKSVLLVHSVFYSFWQQFSTFILMRLIILQLQSSILTSHRLALLHRPKSQLLSLSHLLEYHWEYHQKFWFFDSVVFVWFVLFSLTFLIMNIVEKFDVFGDKNLSLWWNPDTIRYWLS